MGKDVIDYNDSIFATNIVLILISIKSTIAKDVWLFQINKIKIVYHRLLYQIILECVFFAC